VLLNLLHNLTPQSFQRSAVDALLDTGGDWLWAVLVMGGAALAGLAVSVLLTRLTRRLTRQIPALEDFRQPLHRHARAPLHLLLALVGVYTALPFVRAGLPAEATAVLDRLLYIAGVGTTAWLIIALLVVVEAGIAARYPAEETEENVQARKIVTQTRILRRILSVVIGVLALGIVLLQYEAFQEIGTGLLASAGIAGIVFGVAAQPTLGNLVAGFQIAFTQPIRVDDVVIVEGQFGWIEEITLTYVVVRVWDRRRIVLPITHFVNQPFENWTRQSSDLVGPVFLHVDHTAPVDALREATQRIVDDSPHWDGDVCQLVVTGATERTIELRITVSSTSASRLWDLRCEVREKLVAYLQREHPGALPRVRATLDEPPASGSASRPATEPERPTMDEGRE
jgi:small-conductance mechanosensitive channel